MKNIFKSSLLLLLSICLFTACEDDNDSNPVLQQPTTSSFKLNTPSYAATAIDLATSTEIPFTWSQPDYGFPVAAQYQLQVSIADSWTISTDEADADESGATKADYATIEDIFSQAKGTLNAAKLAKALQQIAGWAQDAVPAEQEIKVRVMSVLAGAETIYSNVVTVKTIPYYVELKDAAPVLWYLVGSCIGDGSWGNGADKIGTGLIPLMTIAGEEYDKATGTGKISYTGYFPAGGQFKMVQIPGNWDIQKNFNSFAGIDATLFEGNSDGNVCIKDGAQGYYTITLDTKSGDVSIAPYTATTPNVFTSMAMPGGQNGWDAAAGNVMSPTFTYDGAENHLWTTQLVLDADNELKFAANGGWDYNWGATEFPYGAGTQNGANIPAKAGNYTVFLNDITGQYMFIANE